MTAQTLTTLAAAAAAAALAAAGCGTSEPAGYNNPETLAAALKTSAQQRMDKDPAMYEGAKVTATKCVAAGGRAFKCAGEISTGERYSVTVTVSENGKTYVSDAP